MGDRSLGGEVTDLDRPRYRKLNGSRTCACEHVEESLGDHRGAMLPETNSGLENRFATFTTSCVPRRYVRATAR